MIYSHLEFIIFFTCTLFLYLICKKHSHRYILLSIASLIFYLWAGLFDTILFILVVLISWAATKLSEFFPKYKNTFITFSIALMVINLGFWKYAGWIVKNIQLYFPHFHYGKALLLPLPIGISFFTLQGIAYLLDYKNTQAKYIPLSKYFLYKAFFAQLIAGPICRYHQLMPQLEKLVLPKLDDIVLGVQIFTLGLFKKIAVADRIAPMVDAVFLNPQDYKNKVIAKAVIGYTIQIWADFSGYTDMGRGSARMLGIQLPENFLSPYLSRTPSEFWQRWHITLSSWIRDYIFNPLAMFSYRYGNTIFLLLSLLIAMAICGLWHGAEWNFLLWGIFHGILLIIERPLKTSFLNTYFKKILPVFLQNLLLITAMNILILFSFLLFRDQSFAVFKSYIDTGHVYDLNASIAYEMNMYMGLIFCIGFQIISYYDLNKKRYPVLEWTKSYFDFSKPSLAFASGALLAVIFAVTVFARFHSGTGSFIYFQF